jgi:hypothetical protein
MKTVAIGDTHGRDDWKQVVNQDFDKFIFIGDYFDSFNIPYKKQMENFLDILEFKRQNMNKVVLLIGNHDHHYTKEAMSQGEYYSGFQAAESFQIQYCLMDALRDNLLQMCHIEDSLLFSHAGVTKTWCNLHEIDLENLEQSINDKYIYQPFAFRFNMGNTINYYGDSITQSPIWVRPKSLKEDCIDGYMQVVGHTRQDRVTFDDNLILIDTLDAFKDYLIITDGEITVEQIN